MKAILLLAFALIYSTSVLAQVPVALAPVARQQFLDANAKPLAGGKVCTFNAGTTTPAASYVDINGTILNTNPIVLDSGGFATIYLASQSYKIVVYDASGNSLCPNSGVQQWSQDNVNAFQPVTGALSIIFAGVTSDPSGVAGTVDYRTDIPCFRSFTTVWDCFARLNDTQTVTNKTIDISANTIKTAVNTAGHYPRNNGVQYVDNMIQPADAPAVSSSIANNIGTPTVLNSLAKLLGPPTSVGSAQTVDTGGVVGICIASCGGTGSATIQHIGLAACNFDGATTANDYVQISTTIAGNCRDVGVNFPASGQVIGRVMSSQAIAGAYTMLLFGPEIKLPISTNNPVSAVNLTAQAVNIGATSITTPAANGFYRASCYIVVTQAATTSSTLPSCQIGWTDADTSTAQVTNLTNTNSTNVVGNTGALATTFTPPNIFAKTGVPITYATTGYVSSGATPMQYALHIRLEGPF